MIEFIQSSPYNLFMSLALLCLINLFLIMVLSRFAESKSCAEWSGGEWIMVITISAIIPLGWVIIVIMLIYYYGPELLKERKWPRRQKKGWTGKSGG
jgi:uncharacterized BrkB/YihY/UPF0761 family membrane protein